MLVLSMMERDPDIARVAVYGFDGELVHAIGKEHGVDSVAHRTKMSPHDGSQLTFANAARELLGDASLAQAGMHDHLAIREDIVFDTDADQQKVGEIVVMLTVDNLLSTMKARLLQDVMLATALVIAVLAAAIVAYRRSVEVPLKRMLDSIRKYARK